MDIQGSERTSSATIISGYKSVTKGMTPQLLVPNPKIRDFDIASQELKFDFRVLENIISNNNRWFKICDKGDDTPAPSPNPKIRDFYIASQELKFDFRFIPLAGAQMGLLGS
nr:unnamed protein product [Callosobruchus analis]